MGKSTAETTTITVFTLPVQGSTRNATVGVSAVEDFADGKGIQIELSHDGPAPQNGHFETHSEAGTTYTIFALSLNAAQALADLLDLSLTKHGAPSAEEADNEV